MVVSDGKQESPLNSQRLFKKQWHYFVMSISDCSTLPTDGINLPMRIVHTHISCFEVVKNHY